MLKKVLSVVLALVLALGVCAVAASAVTTKQLSDALNSLPNEYNAHYYKDATEAKILAARAAAEAALETGEGIAEAYALCQDAFDEAYAYEEVEFNDWGDTVAVFYNRDETKAVADYYYETDAPDYLMPGDRFDVVFSVKTDFPMISCRSGIAYDRTIFTLDEPEEDNGSSITICPDLDPFYYDTQLFEFVPRWGFNPATGVKIDEDYQKRFPLTWDDDMKEQYGIAEKEICIGAKTDVFMYPTEKTEFYTLSFKVRDDAPIGATGALFCNQDMVANMETYYLYDGTPFPANQIVRAYGFVIEPVTGLEGEEVTTFIHKDEGAYCNQTINFNGNALKTFTIGEAPAELDYTALEAAVDEAAGYEAAKYTEDSWKVYEDAAAAGAAELTDKALETQDDIDALTKTITDARDALVLAAEDSAEIINITELTTPVVGQYTELEVLVSKPVRKIQFIDKDGDTFTFSPNYVSTIGVEDNEDGTQTWKVKLTSHAAEESYDARVKNYDTGWSDKTYKYVATPQVSENTIISAEVPDAYDGRLKYGPHNIVVTTTSDVTKLQVIYNGTTTTFTPSSTKATVEEVDGKLVWTVKINFLKAGTALPFNFASRSALESWKTSEDVALSLDVVR